MGFSFLRRISRINNYFLSKNYILDIGLGVFLGLFTMILFYNLNYFPVPESDFFAYFYEGSKYLRFSLPDYIKHAPLYSIIIAFFQRLLIIPYSGQNAGIIANIIFFSTGLFLIWRLGKYYLGIFTFLILVLLISNPLSYFVVLHPLNTVSFTFFTILTFYFNQKKCVKLTFLMAIISYFFRYEGIALILALIMGNFLIEKKIGQLIKQSIIGLTPVFLWELLIHFHNKEGNLYFQEIIARKKEIFSPEFFYNSSRFLFFQDRLNLNLTVKNIVLGFIVIWFVLGAILYFLKEEKNNYKKEIIILLIYILLYSFLHFLFPDNSDRYTFPILFILYLFIFWPFYFLNKLSSRKNILLKIVKYCFFGITLALIFNNICGVKSFLLLRRYYRLESRVAGEMLSEMYFPKEAYFIALEPGMINYYNTNNKVIFLSPPNNCNLECIIKNNISVLDNFYLIQDSHVQNIKGYFADIQGASLFTNFEESKNYKDFRLIKYKESHGKWVIIYRYDSNQVNKYY